MIHEVYVFSDAADRQLLGRFDLGISQYRVLTSLQRESALRLTRLSERLLVSKSTITRVVDELEGRGWVRRIPDPGDRRAQQVVLTPRGSERLQKAARAHGRYLEQGLDRLRRTERQQLGSLLEKLSAGLRQTLGPDGRAGLTSDQAGAQGGERQG